MMFRALRLNKFIYKTNFVPSVVRFKHVWTSDNVVKSPFEDIVVPELTVDEYMWRNLEKWPTKTAVFCGVTEKNYTYEEIYKQSRTLAANLIKKFKVHNGDVIGVMSHNIPEYPTVTFGILAAGGVMTTFNPLYTEYEIQRQLELSDVKLMIAHEDYVPVVKQAFKRAKKSIPIISIRNDKPLPENVTSFHELVEDRHIDLSILKQVNRTPNDIALIPYSSGTTGLPKGVELTNRNIVANFEQQNTGIRQYQYTTETHQDTALVILPLFHLYGLGIIMLHKMTVGLKLLTLPKFQPDTFLKSLKDHRSNIVYIVPPIVLFLGTSPQVTPEHLASVRCITVGAAPLSVADAEKMIARSKNSNLVITQGYGMTEAGPLVTMTLPDRTDYESTGYALPNIELRVVDDKMKNLGSGQAGELLIKGPNVMKGYRNNPEANKQVFVEGGWYRSGDIANIDQSGRVFVTDRLKELIKVKGYQVPPAELENVLKEHPAVHDAAVIGIPDTNLGERPKAFVVVAQSAKVNEQEIIDFVAKRVAPYKKIYDVEFVDSIPKSVSGKILRKMLR